ncbi:DUF2806 domain-containing protein [Enterococcus quebecensis]|uniref:DUF2806 domain-containing protein n=1 Tax=Enterococcus quebecensis TaxID=903983 RepID=A0A1E5H1N3_9ENTE|nr:DUF2806 domain-containing protein [Enterococcus quebecensis]OEG18843.1 hypothetical protein BCR23_12945 [Enterococcus quebecensis]
MFNIPAYFQIVLEESMEVGEWKFPKHISEAMSHVLVEHSDDFLTNYFYNQFFQGSNKGKSLYDEISEMMKRQTHSEYIYGMATRFSLINDRNSKFNAEKVAEKLLRAIKNGKNLSGDIRQGLISSYYANRKETIYLFLSEALYYALAVQKKGNTTYRQMEKVMRKEHRSPLFKEKLTWLGLSEEDIQATEFSPRLVEALKIVTKKDIEVFLQVASLSLYDEDGNYYLYKPTTEEEFELYKKYGIENKEFLLMNECGFVDVGVPRKNKMAVFDDELVGFQNLNLVLAIRTKEKQTCQLSYSDFSFTTVGEELMEIIEFNSSNDFFIELAKIMKKQWQRVPLIMSIFDVEDLESFEDMTDIDWSTALII